MARVISINDEYVIELKIQKTFIEKYGLERLLLKSYFLSFGYDLTGDIPTVSHIHYKFPPHNVALPAKYLKEFLKHFKKILKSYGIDTKHTDLLLFLGYEFNDDLKSQNRFVLTTKYQSQTSDLLLTLLTVPFIQPTRDNIYNFLFGRDTNEKNEELLSMLMAYCHKPLSSFTTEDNLDWNKISALDWAKFCVGFFYEKNISVSVEGMTIVVSNTIQLRFDHGKGTRSFRAKLDDQNTQLIQATLHSLVMQSKVGHPAFFNALKKHRFRTNADFTRLKGTINSNVKMDFKDVYRNFLTLFTRYLGGEGIELSKKGTVSKHTKIFAYEYFMATGLLLVNRKLTLYKDWPSVEAQYETYRSKVKNNLDYSVDIIAEYLKRE